MGSSPLRGFCTMPGFPSARQPNSSSDGRINLQKVVNPCSAFSTPTFLTRLPTLPPPAPLATRLR